jgi:cell division initiation protein
MKHTPLDVRHKEFSNSLQGYAKKEVREFLMVVSDDLEEAERQSRSLHERIAQLEATVAELRQGEETLRLAIIEAQRFANNAKDTAKADAKGIVEKAQVDAQGILQDTENQKEALLREALSRVRDIRVEIERLRADRIMFTTQFKSLLQGYLSNIERVEDKTA